MRYIQSVGTFGFANQIYKSALFFYYSASKEVSGAWGPVGGRGGEGLPLRTPPPPR